MDRKTKRALLQACKPEDPVPEEKDERYFDFDDPGLCLRGTPWRQAIAEVIDLYAEPTTQMVTGLPGSGKTTELWRLKTALEARSYRVVMADAGAWIRDDQPITTRDVLLALAIALYPEGKPETAADWLKEYVRQTWAFLSSEARFTELQAGVDEFNVKAQLTANDTLFQDVARRLAGVRGFRDQVFELLARAARGAQENGEPLVMILDGLEKRATGDLFGAEERERFKNHWFGAFLVDARDLRPPVHVVYTVPAFMVRRASELEDQMGRELQFLPMVRVFERARRPDGHVNLYTPGVRAMRDALFKRVQQAHFEDETVATWLAVHSGGYMRDLLRMISYCIRSCPDGQRIGRKLVDDAIVRSRETKLGGLELAEEMVLRQVHADRQFPLDAGNKPLMDGLLQGHKMVRYHNAQCWYEAHPLLWPRLEVNGPEWNEVVAACH